MSTIKELVLETRELKQKRQQYKDKCWSVLREKWETVREGCRLHWNGPIAEDCQVEKAIIREHVEVFEHGVLMTFVVFGTLRLTSHPKFKMVAENYIKPFFRLRPQQQQQQQPTTKTLKKNQKVEPSPKEGNKSNATPKTPKLVRSEQQQHVVESPRAAAAALREKTYLEMQRDQKINKIHSAVDPFMDLFVSFVVGVSSIFFFSRPAQMRLDFEEAPLCPGKSIWSETMCPSFIDILKETDPVVFQIQQSEKKDREKIDANLKSFVRFTLHCQLRAAHIQKRMEAGEAKPLVLPTSGPWDDDDDADQGKEE